MCCIVFRKSHAGALRQFGGSTTRPYGLLPAWRSARRYLSTECPQEEVDSRQRSTGAPTAPSRARGGDVQRYYARRNLSATSRRQQANPSKNRTHIDVDRDGEVYLSSVRSHHPGVSTHAN